MSAHPTTVAGVWRAEVGSVDVVFGAGALGELGPLARERGGRRALVVTDPGVRDAGHAAAACDLLEAAGIAAQVFDKVAENPTTLQAEAGRDAAAAWQADLLVGLGGGSAMDCAKAVNFLFTNGGRMEDYRGWGHAARPMLPSIGIPTTAGTGSEAQSYALISLPDTHQKIACGDRKARFASVILDPQLAVTAPRRAAAAAGLDALAHAVESLVCRSANPISRLWSCAAWVRIEPHLEAALDAAGAAGGTAAAPALAAVGEVLLGAHLAGAAIELSMLGAAHSCANPLTAHHGVVHGVAVSLMLPHVVRWNAGAGVAAPYHDLAGIGSAEQLAARIEALRAAAGLPARLREAAADIDGGSLPALAAEAAQQWTLAFNPRPTTVDDLVRLYQAAL